jgi:hypothetical protein
MMKTDEDEEERNIQLLQKFDPTQFWGKKSP